MNKILGLDVGRKRIGVAVSDGNAIGIWGVIESKNLSDAVFEIGKIIRQEQIQKIVIGIPKSPTLRLESDSNRRTQDTFQADKIHKFAIELTKNFNIEIDYIDETLTSKEAERALRSQKLDPKSKRFKEEVDKLSAKFILEQYLN